MGELVTDEKASMSYLILNRAQKYLCPSFFSSSWSQVSPPLPFFIRKLMKPNCTFSSRSPLGPACLLASSGLGRGRK